jgi:nitrogen fixation protein NifB
MNAIPDIRRHPCFNWEAKGVYGRIHLPVAPECNIKCNYCNRKYDCVNESRPGVSSAILKPKQAVEYLEKVLQELPNIAVAGIAGPGDSFATPESTLETVRLVKEKFPEMLVCLATNGLNALPYIDQLRELKVSHVTVTINAVDPRIGAEIYAWVRDGKVVYRGLKAAELILDRQLAAVKALKDAGIVVKVNSIVIPGINDGHIVEVAKKMKGLGVDIQNLMAMYPNRGTPFQDIPESTPAEISAIQEMAEDFVPQMKHCKRCRADAVGLLDKDLSGRFSGRLAECAGKTPANLEQRPYVAVATLEGMLVNLHLGEAERFQIWGRCKDGYELVGERIAPEPGSGVNRWIALAETLNDCRAVLVSGIGSTPRRILVDSNITPIEMTGFISMGLKAVYAGKDVGFLKSKRTGCSKSMGCMGDGLGCG